MTENEAIKVIRDKACNDRYKGIHCDDSCMYAKDKCAFCMAINALYEIQQYRAIGTVEEIQSIKDQLLMVKDMCKDYYEIGTIDEFKALKEKNEQKKAIGKRKHDEAYCPACNEVISDGEFWALAEYVHHCNYCGQAVKGVDWSE